MVYVLRRFLCCIPLRAGAQICVWITCLTRLLLVFTTIYLATFVLKTESNLVAPNYPDISNNSFYYEIGYGIDQLLFFTRGTYVQRYVILTGLTAVFQLIACVCALYAVDKGSPTCLIPWLVMFSHACLLETWVSLSHLGVMLYQGPNITQDVQAFIPDVVSAISHGVFLTYFVWVVYSFYLREKLRLARPLPMAPPLSPYYPGEASPPYNPTLQNSVYKDPNKYFNPDRGRESPSKYKFDTR